MYWLARSQHINHSALGLDGILLQPSLLKKALIPISRGSCWGGGLVRKYAASIIHVKHHGEDWRHNFIRQYPMLVIALRGNICLHDCSYSKSDNILLCLFGGRILWRHNNDLPKTIIFLSLQCCGLVLCLHSFVKSPLLSRSAVINIHSTSQQSWCLVRNVFLTTVPPSMVRDSKSEETV